MRAPLNRYRSIILMMATILLGVNPTAWSQTGVSDDRVSLPDGPGSMEGIGDDISVNPNMGAMSYSVPIIYPTGFPGMTPSLSLSYSSANGNSVAGMGWSFPTESIERLTLRGVPQYDADDELEANGGEQMVVVDSGSDNTVYRSRFEGSFVRYTWHDVGDGTEGYFTAEYPDGRVGYFGADSDGNLVDTARVGGDQGTFRYLLAEMTDVWGHRVEYHYGVYGSTNLLEGVDYVFVDGDPIYQVQISYEDRQDWMSDATGGFEEVLDQRLAEIAVVSRGTTIRRYAMSYESYATSGGFTRLSEVETFGVGDARYPASFTFGYSLGLGEICDSVNCQMPFTVDMTANESLGLDLRSGDATLVDINGDALPDIIASLGVSGEDHQIFLNQLDANGDHYFAAPYDSAVGNQSNHDFSSEYVQAMDVNGDGFTDLVNALTGAVLFNRGGGDWDNAATALAESNLADDLAADFSDGELQTIRFMDYDNNRMIDLIRSSGNDLDNVTSVYRNTGDNFVSDTSVDSLGVGFDSDQLELNDFNGDGLLDAVQVTQTQIRYRLNLGWGRFAAWRTAASVDFEAQEAIEAELEDLNGDSLSDLVLVQGSTIRLWINKNGAEFHDELVIESADIDGSLPTRAPEDSVLYADMNGNGSSDIVWITSSGDVTYLELFPVRPNLISRVENGLGLVIDVTYGTHVEHMARDGGSAAWQHRLPFPNIVVDELDEWDRLTHVHRITTFAYHDGFYDGIEKAFRGFERVEEALIGDDSQEDGLTLRQYDIGTSDPYSAGNLLIEEIQSGGRSLNLVTYGYDDCDLADVPASGLLFDVRYVCQTSRTEEIREGLRASEWVTLRSSQTYDGYGNTTLEFDEGVVSVGGGGCGVCERADDEFGEPCGNLCLGDEQYTESQYITPGASTSGKWMLGFIHRQRVYGQQQSEDYAETVTYYDGDFFVGLPEGQLELGSAARVTSRVNQNGDVIEVSRTANDEHGNTVEEISALGEIDGPSHRREWTYDATGLFPVSVRQIMNGAEGSYALRQDYRYEPLYDEPILATSWYVEHDGQPLTEVANTLFAYDAFGRVTAIADPGDSLDSPTRVFEYDVDDTVSRAIIRARTVQGGPLDEEWIQCIDGRGRTYQTRLRIDDGYTVTGFEVFSVQGTQREQYLPYESQSAECDQAPPAGVEALVQRMDALDRVVRSTQPHEQGRSVDEFVYEPLRTLHYNATDTAAGSAHADTPMISVSNGLGETIARGRIVAAGAEPEWYTMAYNERGDLIRVTDPAGNSIHQEFNLMGWIVSSYDADRGEQRFTYSDLGDLTRVEDDAGDVIIRTYDSLSRLTSQRTEDAQGADAGGEVDYVYDYDWSGACPAPGCGASAGFPVAAITPLDGGEAIEWSAWDGRGRLVAKTVELNGTPITRTYQYDNIDQPLGTTYPGGHTVSMELGAGSRLRSLPDYIDRIEYDDRGNPTTIALANGITEQRRFSYARRMLSLDMVGPDSQLLIGRDFSWNGEQWLTAIDERVGGDIPADLAVTYDALGRLVEAHLSAGSNHDETVSYVYDSADNLTSRTSSLGDASPVHDGARELDATRPHAVVQAGGLTLDYNARGEMVQRGSQTLDWDGARRLARVTDGQTITEHVYGAGEELLMTRTSDGSVTWFLDDDLVIDNGVASIYVSQIARHETVDMVTLVLNDVAPATGDDSALVSAPDGAINAADAWLAFADEQGFLTLADGNPSATNELLSASAAQELIERSDRITWLHEDQIENLVAVSDEAGQIIEWSHRYPYGAPRTPVDAGAEPVSFTGLRTEMGGELVRTETRLYDPLLARWLSPDPLFATVSSGELGHPWEAMGAYVYGWSSPLSGQDETGQVWNADTALLLLNLSKRSRPNSDLNRIGDMVSYRAQFFNGPTENTTVTATSFALDLVFQEEANIRNHYANDARMLQWVDDVLTNKRFRNRILTNALMHDLRSSSFTNTDINDNAIDWNRDNHRQYYNDHRSRLNRLASQRANRVFRQAVSNKWNTVRSSVSNTSSSAWQRVQSSWSSARASWRNMRNRQNQNNAPANNAPAAAAAAAGGGGGGANGAGANPRQFRRRNIQ